MMGLPNSTSRLDDRISMLACCRHKNRRPAFSAVRMAARASSAQPARVDARWLDTERAVLTDHLQDQAVRVHRHLVQLQVQKCHVFFPGLKRLMETKNLRNLELLWTAGL